MLASSASGEGFLIVATVLNVGAALLHVGILIGGAPWYRTFGAGESMAQTADAGKLYPSIVTLGVICTLLVWAAYALSGAGVIARLPYLLPILIAITTVYLLRGALFFPLFAKSGKYTRGFMVWSSLICFGFGFVHLAGVYGQWPTLSQAPQSAPPADFISPSPNVQRAELSLEECLATGGRVRGDIGDGAIHAPDFVCESSQRRCHGH